MADSTEITRLLQAGDAESLDQLLPLVYNELKALASALFRSERSDHTLQPTALVHEAYLRLVADADGVSWQNRAHFFGIAANSMRQILVNYAVARSRQKRGSGQTKIALDESVSFSYAREMDVLTLNDALQELSRLDGRQAKIVELRFFGGLTLKETAEVMEISTATVSREWEMARTWLYREMSGDA